MWVYFTIVLVFCAAYPIIPRKHIKWLFLALVLALSVMAFLWCPMRQTISATTSISCLHSERAASVPCEDAFKTVIITGTRFPSADFISILSAASRITGCFLPLRYFWLMEVCSGCCGGLRRDTK